MKRCIPEDLSIIYDFLFCVFYSEYKKIISIFVDLQKNFMQKAGEMLLNWSVVFCFHKREEKKHNFEIGNKAAVLKAIMMLLVP